MTDTLAAPPKPRGDLRATTTLTVTGGYLSGNALGYTGMSGPGQGTIDNWLDDGTDDWIAFQARTESSDVDARVELLAVQADPLAWAQCFFWLMVQWYGGAPSQQNNVGVDTRFEAGGNVYGSYHASGSSLNTWQWTSSPYFALPASALRSTPLVRIWCGSGAYRHADPGSPTGVGEWQRVNAVSVDVVKIVNSPIAGGVGPTGVVNTNTPTIVWTPTPAPGATVTHFQVQVLSGGVVEYDSGQRPHTTPSFQMPVALGPGPRTVKVRLWQQWWTGAYYVSQVGDWGTAAFTISPAAPPVPGPTIPTNVVAQLPATDLALLTRPHRPTFQAWLYQWDGSARWALDIVSGSVTYDGTNRVRSTASLVVANSELVPSSAAPLDFAKPLHPFGQYVHLARGVGASLVSLGTFRVERVEVESKAEGSPPVRVDLRDWAAFLADARGTYPRTRQNWTATPAPMWVDEVIKAIVAEAGCALRMPQLASSRVETNYTNDRGFDRTEALDGLVSAVGWTWYADHDGVIFAGAEAKPATDPVRYAFVEGTDAVILSKGITLDRAEVFDFVVTTNDDQSIFASAYDSSMASPIQRSAADTLQPWLGRGPFSPGGKPFFFASPVITTTGAAQSSAASVLKRRALPADAIRFAAVPVPDLRPGHVVTVLRVGATVAERFMVAQLELPLDVQSTMTVTAVAQAPYVSPVTP